MADYWQNLAQNLFDTSRQHWASYLEVDTIPTKIGFGRDEIGSGRIFNPNPGFVRDRGAPLLPMAASRKRVGKLGL